MAVPDLVADGNPQAALRRIGLELHDGPLQELAALSTRLYTLRESLAPDAKLVGSTNAIIAGVGDVADQLRACIREARGCGGSGLTLLETLERTFDLYADAFTLDLDIDPAGAALPERHCEAVARVVQTALGNVAQHSGADCVRVALRCEPESTVLEIVDNGCGFSVERTLRRAEATGRLGLASVLERIHALGGEVDIASGRGGPTLVRATLPAAAASQR